MPVKIINSEQGWWVKLQSTLHDQRIKFKEDLIQELIRNGRTKQQAIDLFHQNAKFARRFDCDIKPWKPSVDFKYNMGRLGPGMRAFLERAMPHIPKNLTAAYKKPNPELLAKRKQMKEMLMSQGIDEKDAEKMIKVIK